MKRQSIGDYVGDYIFDYTGDYTGDYMGDYTGCYVYDYTGDCMGDADVINSIYKLPTRHIVKGQSIGWNTHVVDMV